MRDDVVLIEAADGVAVSFSKALMLEAARPSAANATVKREEVAARRAAVQQRGRAGKQG